MVEATRAALLEELLQARFDEDQHKSFTKEWTNKRGERKSAGPFTYVEDETVYDRLDDVFGQGQWKQHVEAVGERCALVEIAAKHPTTGEWYSHSDFGYCTNDDSDEPLKEATTDGVRRVGRIFGIARYVYAGEVGARPTTTTIGQASAPSAASTSAPAATTPSSQPAAEPSLDDICPIHGWTWSVQKGGTSAKTGKPYHAFYKCGGKTNGQFCTEKPSEDWVKAHPIAS